MNRKSFWIFFSKFKKIFDKILKFPFQDLDQLTNTNVPDAISLKRPLDLPPALDEWRMLTVLRSVAAKNEIYRSYIGMGYYDCIVPGVITRNILQNAGWLTR